MANKNKNSWGIAVSEIIEERIEDLEEGLRAEFYKVDNGLFRLVCRDVDSGSVFYTCNHANLSHLRKLGHEFVTGEVE